MLISDKIFEILKEKGMSQKTFAEKTKIPQSTISDWKNKRVNLSSEKISVICRVLGVSPIELLSVADEEYTESDYMVLVKNTDEYYLMEKFRNMDDSTKELMLQVVKRISGNMDK